MARAVAEELARRGNALDLAGRDLEDLERTAADLAIRYEVQARAISFDALDLKSHTSFAQKILTEPGSTLEGVILLFGTMTDQKEAEQDFRQAELMIAGNYTGAASILGYFANAFEVRKSGVIVGVSSVAGDRGRQSNYIYGSAKGALSLYLQGLRNRLFHSGVRVITVKPGFVDTAMTYGLKLPPIVAPPSRVARDICRAMDGQADVVYTPFFWRYIMLIIQHIPEFVFKRLKL